MPPISVLRHLYTGADRYSDDAAMDAPGTPSEPISTGLPFVPGVPWIEGKEDMDGRVTVPLTAEPTYPHEDVGGVPFIGAYEGAVRTRGPVQQWSHEPSGGPWSDQALGRTQRFDHSSPNRYSASGVMDGNYADELAAAIAHNGQGLISESEFTTNLLLFR